ncbi:hypothetical protein SAMN04488591_1576 [Microbacterium azadirachtae]|uniref:Uncharacterized protein n=1 Tax=Microbacterium azadirachtae TaxID=582680 RepID=A0A1I6GUB1_9MICO|nr:hypothetical protein [Microbacterium azadirachtae]SFR45748.1 hypothetical protein SAMN04488591_1576 [Microbacterium azadirachtae]
MSTTTTVEDDWVRRIGPAAAKARRTRARLRIWAWSLVLVTIVTYAALAGAIAGFRRTRDDFAVVLLLLFLGAFSLLSAIFCGMLARSTRFRMEGAALAALRPTVSDATPREIRTVLRRADRFDHWARERGAGAPRAASPGPVSSANEPWQPDVLRPILPGRTSFQWFRLALGMLIAAAPLMMVIMLTGLILRRLPSAPIIVLMLWCLLPAWMLLTLGCSIIGQLRQAAEYRAGYRTAVARTRGGAIIDDRTGVDLVDPKTGFVIRPAGAPSLDRVTYDARLREIRAAHPDATPRRLG